MGLMETVIDIPAEHEANVFGQFDAYAKKIERRHNAVTTPSIQKQYVFMSYVVV